MTAALLLMANWVSAQSYSNDFENGYEWYPPWSNLHLAADDDTLAGNHVCLCDTLHEYGLGFSIDAERLTTGHHLNCQFGFSFKARHDTQADVVVTINDATGLRYWNAYPLADFVSDTAEWSQMQLNLNFPSDYLGEATVKGFVWNKGQERLVFDEARLEVNASLQPSYQPEIGQDSLSPYNRHFIINQDFIPIVEYINADGDTVNDPSIVETDIKTYLSWNPVYSIPNLLSNIFKTETRFKEDVKLLRLAFVLPLPKGELTVYRKNQHIDTTDFQTSYYLDREGFSIANDTLSLATYHNTGISSLQLDTEKRYACFNIDYWRDHPLIHYPMRTDTSDYFEDISYREIKAGDVLKGEFTLYESPWYFDTYQYLPRLMPVWDGYQSAFIFTEHADWTDLSTHRAVLFGNENITTPEAATGGFCHYGIPVTKSVFYWNPDHITNAETSGGLFNGEVATIKTDKGFFRLLKRLRKEGFEICLHSPEVYTTLPSEFAKAMRFMKRQFGTVSWIDHGYNNGPEKNREDMVCDGLLPQSPQYAAGLWKKNGVRYLWNAYYEENRMEQYHFDSHFVQPYDGFGDALPNRQITTLPNGDKDFRLWSTPSTLEVNDDKDWYYYFDSTRLQKLVDHHNVFITHVYPAWSDPYRGFWQYDDDSTAVAMPGFNFALSQLARFRDEKKILPTTVEQYLDYYEKLLKVDYLILDNHSIQLINDGETIEGLTLLCTQPIDVEGHPINFRKVEEGYLVWFDLKKNETVTIKIRE
jgi:hypothetical protein